MMYKCPNCKKPLKWDKDRKKTQVRIMKGIMDPTKTFMICRLCKQIDDAELFKVMEKKKRIPKPKPESTPC